VGADGDRHATTPNSSRTNRAIIPVAIFDDGFDP
jgi:hypothetical protein